MSIQKLMHDPKAAAIWQSIDDHIHPATLADNYLAAKLAGRTSECLALETYLRDLARMHFDRMEVLEALQTMERAKARRKMGKGGTKMLKDIAGQLRQLYRDGMYTVEDDGRLLFFVFTGGAPGSGKRPHLKIRCKNAPGAVELVACKYERGHNSKQRFQ
jgi:hypothetical protein